MVNRNAVNRTSSDARARDEDILAGQATVPASAGSRLAPNHLMHFVAGW
jgi:hypothetical protein